MKDSAPQSSGRHGSWWRRHWSRFILWEVCHPWTTLTLCGIVVAALVWQSHKLPKRLRGGLVSMPGSESAHVLNVVEKDFSTAIAYPTILVQEGLGNQLEASWNSALNAMNEVPAVRKVIDMHLGRKIVATIVVNTTSWQEAQEMIGTLRDAGLPEKFEVISYPKVSYRDQSFTLAIEADVRSFKEGEELRASMEECLSKIKFPEGSKIAVDVERHPRRNFAMIEADVHSYQEAESLTSSLQKGLGDLDLPMNNRVRITGLPALFYDLNKEAISSLRKAEWIGLPVCFLLLIWVFGSPAAATLPILVALIALFTGSAVMSKVGKYIEISMYVPSVLSMIGLGVAVDYMLILLSRFRECLAKHPQVNEAIMEAMHLALPTLVGSGLTVALGFTALVATPITLFRAMGIAGIVVILSALFCIVVLSPPLFRVTHRWMPIGKPPEVSTTFWKRWTQFVAGHPLGCFLGGVALMGAVIWPVLDLEMGSMNPDNLPSNLESKQGYSLCKNSFGAGWLMPAVIVVSRPEGMSMEEYIGREREFIRKLRAMPSTFDAVGASDLSAAELQGFRIEIPEDFFMSRSGENQLILAMYDGNPMSVDGRKWIEDLRRVGHEIWKNADGFKCKVGGVVASTLDVDRAVRIYIVRTAIFCMVSTFICIALMYRALLIPLQAIAMNLLSVTGAYGFLVFWFQKGVGAFFLPSIISSGTTLNSIVILLLFCALFGLSMDYQVFLISRMAEEWRRTHNNKLAVRHGIELTGRVVTGAAVIMVSIFLSFAFVSVMETRQFGTGMAAAIILDATIIRLLVFPSSMLLVGKANWWWPFRKKSRH